jgi:hypothetical protein
MSNTAPTLPELPLEAWKETKTTLHLYAQIVGKIRLALSPKQNHWWHIPLYVSARGTMPAGGQLLEIGFDFVDHNLVLRSSTGGSKAISLYDGLSVAQFYGATVAVLGIGHLLVAQSAFFRKKPKNTFPTSNEGPCLISLSAS